MATTNLAKPTSFERALASARSTMLFSEVVRLAVDSFRSSKTRFLLTMLGMVIGSASGRASMASSRASSAPRPDARQYRWGHARGK